MVEQGCVHELFAKLINEWSVGDPSGESAIQSASPAFIERADSVSEEFTFDAYFHTGPVDGWSWKALEFSEAFQGAFTVYLPDKWADVRIHRTTANVLEGDKIRQSIFILDKASWVQTLPSFLEEFEVESFAHYCLLPPAFDQWIFTTRDKTREVDWLYAIYSAGDWLFVTKADANTPSLLFDQLTSILNSNPWFGWIQEAKKQAATASGDEVLAEQ